MDNLHQEIYKKRAVKNIFVLIGRSGILQLVNFIGAFVLTIFLDPAIFGIFTLVSAIINFLNYFSDVGLAASLIHKKEAVTARELKCVFTVQQILVFSISVLALSFLPLIKLNYNLNQEAVWLFYAFLSSFIFSSLKTIPSVLLERELKFEKLVIPQVTEAILFNGTAVYLAFAGQGLMSFTWAVFARGFGGLVILYLIQPWKVGFDFHFKTYREHFKFGLPFQANSFLAMIKDDLLTVFLGKCLSLHILGLIGWAQKWAFMPLRFILDNVTKIAFSALSRIQDDAKNLEKAVNKAIFGTTLLTTPILMLINIAALFLVDLIPKYGKWSPALPFLICFSFNAALASSFINSVNFLNACGRIKLTLKLMIFWTITSWILNLLLINFLGSIGVGIAAIMMGILSCMANFFAGRIIRLDWQKIVLPIFFGLASEVVILNIASTLDKNFVNLYFCCVFAVVIYFGLILVFLNRAVKEEMIFLTKNIK